MKRTRILIALLLVLMLTIGMPLSALAAVHDVSTAEDVLNVVATDTDAEVTMNMQNDIDMDHSAIAGNEGQSYVINGNGNAISNVVVDSSDVTVNADMDGYNYVAGDAEVAVDGDIENITVSEEASLSVDGNVEYVGAEGEAAVDITGDVGSVAAVGEATVDITGDVTGSEYYWTAIDASGQAQVSVDGNVSGSDGYIAPEDQDDPDAGAHGGTAIEAWGEAVVTVTGDVSGGDGALSEAGMEESDGYGDGSTAIMAYGDVTVTVGGDVTGGDAMGTYGYAGTGINAGNGAVVTVGGDVSGGDVVADPNVEVHTVEDLDDEGNVIWTSAWNSQAGDGIHTDSTTTITVGGDVTGGSTNANNGEGGDALYITPLNEDPDLAEPEVLGSVTIGGIISGGTGDAGSEYGADGYDVSFDGVVGYPKDIVNELLKLDAEDLLDEDGNYTDEYFALMNVLTGGVDEETIQKYAEDLLDDYTEEELAEMTDEEWVALELELIRTILNNEDIDVDAMNEEYANTFSKLSIGGYDDDPSFFSYDDENGAAAAAYMDENVKPLAATPATGDSFNLVLVGTVAILALLAMTATVVIRKKHV